MTDHLKYSLVACDGARLGHQLLVDDFGGAVFFLHMMFERHFTVWLRDRDRDTLIGQSNAGCPSCASAGCCGDFLDMATDEVSHAFWGHILGRQT